MKQRYQREFPKPEKDSGKGRVTFRCTEKEIKWLNKQGEKYGLTRAGYAKRKAFDVPITFIPK